MPKVEDKSVLSGAELFRSDGRDFRCDLGFGAEKITPPEQVRLLGISEVDEDHLRLGHIIAELELYVGEPASIEVSQVASRLVQATCEHFRREEEIMELHQYPLVEQHRTSHRDLLRFVESIAEGLSVGRITVDAGLISALWEWELTHIDVADRDYADYALRRKTPAPQPT